MRNLLLKDCRLKTTEFLQPYTNTIQVLCWVLFLEL